MYTWKSSSPTEELIHGDQKERMVNDKRKGLVIWKKCNYFVPHSAKWETASSAESTYGRKVEVGHNIISSSYAN